MFDFKALQEALPIVRNTNTSSRTTYSTSRLTSTSHKCLLSMKDCKAEFIWCSAPRITTLQSWRGILWTNPSIRTIVNEFTMFVIYSRAPPGINPTSTLMFEMYNSLSLQRVTEIRSKLLMFINDKFVDDYAHKIPDSSVRLDGAVFWTWRFDNGWNAKTAVEIKSWKQITSQ